LKSQINNSAIRERACLQLYKQLLRDETITQTNRLGSNNKHRLSQRLLAVFVKTNLVEKSEKRDFFATKNDKMA